MTLFEGIETLSDLTNMSDFESEKGTDVSSEHDLFIPNTAPRRTNVGAIWPWRVATALFATTSLLFGVTAVIQRGCSETAFNDGQLISSSDFSAAGKAIELQEVKFTGSPAFDLNGTAYVAHPGLIQYFGEPSEELDGHWEELAGSYNFLLSDTEAKRLWPKDYQKHWDSRVNGYPVGLEVFHTLHCINHLRKLFHPDHYPVMEKHMKWQKQHRDHCLDQLRQYVMCAGDMTPYGTMYYEGIGYNYADTDVTHTCRNFDRLREWTTRRYYVSGVAK